MQRIEDGGSIWTFFWLRALPGFITWGALALAIWVWACSGIALVLGIAVSVVILLVVLGYLGALASAIRSYAYDHYGYCYEVRMAFPVAVEAALYSASWWFIAALVVAGFVMFCGSC